MKKCPKCNAELSDDAVFCNVCGEKLVEVKKEEVKKEEVKKEEPKKEEAKKEDVKAEEVAPASNEVLENAQETSKNAQVGLIAVVAAIAILAIVLVVILAGALGGGYKKPINQLVKNLNKRSTNVEAYLECVAPKSVVSSYSTIYKVVTGVDKEAKNDLNDAIEDAFEDIYDSLEDTYGEDAKITFEIAKAKKMSKSDLKDVQKNWKNMGTLVKTIGLDDDDFWEELSDALDDEYDKEISNGNLKKLEKTGDKLAKDLKDAEVTDGYEIKLKYTIKGKEDKDSDKIEFNVIKINGQWIIDGSSYYSEVARYARYLDF